MAVWLQDFHFVRSWWFIALIPFVALLWWLQRHTVYKTVWEKVCDAQLLPFILLGRSVSENKRFLYLIALAGVLAITALAGPAWQRLPQPTFRDYSALVIAVDLSRSMDAVDVQPSRLQRARFKISDFLKQYQQEVALVTYSDSAFVTVPLTDDMNAIELFLESLNTNLMPTQGSRPDKALRLAEELLKRRGIKQGNIILVTDHGNQSAVDVAEVLSSANYRTSVWGIGTQQGGPVYLQDGALLTDNGETVVPKLDESILRRIAVTGGGIYQRLNVAGDDDVDSLVEWAQAMSDAERDPELQEGLSDMWYEQGPWLLLLLLPLSALAFRRGLLVLLITCSMALPPSVQAVEWSDLWLRRDQQAARMLEQGDAEQAAEMFEDKEWKAAAQYRNGNFDRALETLQDVENARSLYNKGNAAAYAGDLEAAVKAYTEALSVAPAMEDAIHNMGVVRQIMQQMQVQESDEAGDEQQDGQQAQKSDSDQSSEEPDQQQQDSDDAEDTDGEEEQQSEGEQEGEPADDGQETAENDEQSAADDENTDTEGTNDEELMGEEEQALEQIFQQVQDNPQQLLRRKFKKMEQDRQRTEGRRPRPEVPW